MMNRLLVLLILCLVQPAQCLGQLKWVPRMACGDNLQKVTDDLKSATAPADVQRDAAIGGRALMPILRLLSKPEQPLSSVPGAAQVALARLGDQHSWDELDQEMWGKPDLSINQAIEKVGAVRSDHSIALLMAYVDRYRRDPKSAVGRGAGENPLIQALAALIAIVDDSPYSYANTDPAHLNRWDEWWRTAKVPLIVPIDSYPGLSDDKSQCFARLAESGFPDAVRDLYLHLGQASVPALQSLANLGGADSGIPSIDSVSSEARLILAKAGDKEQFEKIAKELNDLDYDRAITKLLYVANDESFEALLHSLSLADFPKYRYYGPDNTIHFVGEKLQKSVMAALSQMVVTPPLPSDAPATEANIQIWKSWWEANKGKNPLREVPF